MDRRDLRHAENEALIQGLDQTIGRFHTDYRKRRLEFTCECGSPICKAKLRLTQEEYEIARRNHPAGHLVCPGHDDPTTEQVALRTDRFLVIESEETVIIEQTDLRTT